MGIDLLMDSDRQVIILYQLVEFFVMARDRRRLY